MNILLGQRLTQDGEQVPSLGFEFEGMFIADPYLSECGRFEVDPHEYYGLSEDDLCELHGKFLKHV